MTQQDYVYRRPRADLSIQQDATARVAAEKQLEDLKKAESGDFELLFVDASTVNLEFPIRACWMKRRQQKRLDAPPGPLGFQHVMGAYNWRTAQISHQIVGHKNSSNFIEFLDYLLMEGFANSAVVLVIACRFSGFRPIVPF
jgi:hypothetical protein